MPAGYQDPSVRTLLSNVVATPAMTSSAVFDLPQVDCYMLVLVPTAVAGTTPSLNAILQTAVDNGVTWVNTGNAFASATAAGATSAIAFKPTLGLGEAASVITVTAGTASAKNQPIYPKYCRLSLAVTGTSVTFSLYMIANPKGYSSM